MDIIITAPNGMGKSQTARRFLAQYFRVNNMRDIQNGALFEADFVGTNASYLAQKIRECNPMAIVFDGCITTPTEMLTAVAAVKKYREQTGRAQALAIYVEQQPGSAVVLVDVYNPKGIPAPKQGDEFASAVQPLMDYLQSSHHPHIAAIVTSENAQLVEGLAVHARTPKPIKTNEFKS